MVSAQPAQQHSFLAPRAWHDTIHDLAAREHKHRWGHMFHMSTMGAPEIPFRNFWVPNINFKKQNPFEDFGDWSRHSERFNDVSGYATNISSNIYKWITDEGDSSSSSIISGGDVSTSAKRRPVRTSLIFGCSAGTSGRSSWTVTKITIKILWIDQNLQRYWYPLFIFDYVPS